MVTPTAIAFQTMVPGKWILVGEHAVLRGHPAILFPVKEKSLILRYFVTEEEIRAEFSGDFGDESQFLFWSALERAIEILNIHHSQLSGRFHIENQIPVGAGMGASAALCVAIGRWFAEKGLVTKENLHEFARQLENLFHSESSGADIAVAIAGEGIYFSRSGGLHAIIPRWRPKWYLSYSDKVSITARCVKKVKELWQQNLKLAEKIDKDMSQCVALAERALIGSPEDGLPMLVTALNKASKCFKRWGLLDEHMEQHMEKLFHAGALAAKPTGSGDGGYILSLWNKKPPKNIGIDFVTI
jgi:mevalonate kinase